MNCLLCRFGFAVAAQAESLVKAVHRGAAAIYEFARKTGAAKAAPVEFLLIHLCNINPLFKP